MQENLDNMRITKFENTIINALNIIPKDESFIGNRVKSEENSDTNFQYPRGNYKLG